MTDRRALTLIELLAVLGIIAILLGLLLPAVQSARARAQETVCRNNLHQMNLAVAQFAELNKRIPDAVPPGVLGGWTVDILPILEQKTLWQGIPIGRPVAEADETLLPAPQLYRCPMRWGRDQDSDDTMAAVHYVLVPTSRRDSFMLFDAPVQLVTPWASGPEMDHFTVTHSIGPHHEGHFYVRGFQQGVGFMIGGRDIH